MQIRPRVPKAPPVRTVPGTRLEYDSSDLSDGKLSLMVWTRDQRTLERLSRRLSHDGSKTGDMTLVRGLVAEVPEKDAAAFVRGLPAATRVSVDSTLHYPSEIFRSGRTSPHTPAPPPVGPLDVDRVVMNMDKVWAAGYTGQGVTGALIDSGCFKHPDVVHGLAAWNDVANDGPDYYDAFGHGTVDGGLMIGNGAQSQGVVRGTAPDGKLVVARITTVSEAIQALDWVVANKDKFNISVVNMSLGDTATQSYKTDLWCQACEKAIAAGLIVLVASGNEGPAAGTISTPGIDPKVITVGGMDDHKGTDFSRFTEAAYEDGQSSNGPTHPDGLPKPDLLSPAINVWGPLSPNSKKDIPSTPHLGRDYIALSGSSQGTALLSGLVMCLKQACPSLTQQQVKAILQRSARRLPGLDDNHQGAGVVDGWAALQMALVIKARGAAASAASPAS